MLLSKDLPKSTGRKLCPVFVAGCQRSDTTPMGQVIGVHRLAVLVDETDDPSTRIHVISDPSDDTSSETGTSMICAVEHNMKTVLFIVGRTLGHISRSLVIARVLDGITPGIRIVLAHIVPGHGSSLLEPEFECVPMSFGKRGDEAFADQIEATIRSAASDLICLDLSPVTWLYLVPFLEISKAYITNYFLTALTPENIS